MSRQILRRDTAEARPQGAVRGDPRRELMWLGGALVASVLIVAVLTRQAALVAGFGAGLLGIGGIGWGLLQLRRGGEGDGFAEPDWSVTVAALEIGDGAAGGMPHPGPGVIAVTDRAGRLVCANARFAAWFGAEAAPPHLPLTAQSAERLARAGRVAWRDGAAQVDLLEGAEAYAGLRWRAQAARAGRAEDHLVWRFTAIASGDPLADLVRHLDGKFGRALSQAGFAVAVVDPDGEVRAVNAAFAREAAEPGTPVVGRDFLSFLAQGEGELIYWARDVRRSAPLTMFYLPAIDPDAPSAADPSTMPAVMLLVEANAGMGGGGRVAAAAVHLEALLATLPLGLAMADRDGRLLFANAAFMRAAGREGAAAPTYPTDLVVREDKAAMADAVRRYAQGSGAGDVAVRLAAQPDDPVTLSLAGIRGLGEAAVLLGLTDTTEETRLKRQVAQATKMQAVGQLAGGVAHDFNNVLTAIIGTCDLMLLRHTPGDSDYDDIQQIRANSNRAASLTRQLLAFSRQQTLRPQVLQLPDIVSDIGQMLRRLIGEKIVLSVTHDRDLGPVRADPTQLEQVIVNLVVNARDAMQDHARGDGAGRMRIMTRRVTSADVRGMRSEILPIADYTALIIEDSGGGIPAEILGKIWEPFFTTKETGKGTGLGLSTVYGIVKQSGGFIFADNIVHEGRGGARFSIYLPVHHGVAEALPTRAREESANWAGGGDVLLVEDEDTVRAVAERALARAGYTVTVASDGDEGLDKVRGRAGAGLAMFDLVVSDVVMPVMDGPAMARAIREIVPGMPVLFMSGYAEEQLRREIDLSDVHFLPKPFSVQQIAGKVAAVMGQVAAKG